MDMVKYTTTSQRYWLMPGASWLIFIRTGNFSPSACCLTGVGVGTELLKPWPLKFIIDTVLVDEPPSFRARSADPGPPWSDKTACSPRLCVGILLIFLSASTLNLVSKYLLVKVSLRVLTQVRCDLFRHLQRLSLRFHDRNRVGDSLYTLNTNIYSFRGSSAMASCRSLRQA